MSKDYRPWALPEDKSLIAMDRAQTLQLPGPPRHEEGVVLSPASDLLSRFPVSKDVRPETTSNIRSQRQTESYKCHTCILIITYNYSITEAYHRHGSVIERLTCSRSSARAPTRCEVPKKPNRSGIRRYGANLSRKVSYASQEDMTISSAIWWGKSL
jgi:hypothetical protein